VIGRLSRGDAADLLAAPGDDGQLAALRQEKAAIAALIAERNQLHVDQVITTAELVEGRRQLRGRLDAVEQRIAGAARADLLAPLIADPAGVWETMALDQRRAVISRLMTVTLMPAPKGRPRGWRPGEPYFSPSSVSIGWRK
jgi:site-specific DNA recombinase